MRQHEVAAAGQPEAAADGRAFDHRHGGHVERTQAFEEAAEFAVAQGHRIVVSPSAGGQALGEVADIAARAEHALRTAQHDGPRTFLLRPGECGVEGLDHLRRQRVAAGVCVEQQDVEALADVVKNLAHRLINPICLAITCSITSSAPPPMEPSR
ncbi:hypothetical protein D9M71_106140 [compost metagenome]